ncbi:MAG: Hydrolase [Candidatus Taylorbacteria bacterium]|nr:Hydrolase [Candidatus Taylorbacteria bacterium]
MPISFSPIQNQILTQLKNAKSLRYSEMKPKAVPNDLFNYHLQFLVKKSFIRKVGGAKATSRDGYQLTEIGVKHVADAYPLNKEEEKNASLFKINVITIVSRRINDRGEPVRKGGRTQILNQIRGVHPSYGKIGVPGGVVRKGEEILAAAARKLEDETGLVSYDFRLLGFQRRMMYVNHELFSDVMFPISYAETFSGELISESKFGRNVWVGIDQAIQNESAEFDSLVKIRDVLVAIKAGKIKKLPFFYEENVQSDS